MPGNSYYEDLKTTRQWEDHQKTLKQVYNKPRKHEQFNPEYPHKDYDKYIPQKEYAKKKKPEWTAADQALEDSLWDE